MRTYWVGYVNIDVMNSPLANSYINFGDSKGIKIESWKPTLHKACLDHIFNMGTLIHSVKILNANITNHNMILFKIGKNSSTECVFTKVKRISDQELSSWISTPMSVIQMELKLRRLASEIALIYERSHTIIREKEKKKHVRWFYHPEVVELRALIRKAEPLERNKVKNRYINIMRRIKV